MGQYTKTGILFSLVGGHGKMLKPNPELVIADQLDPEWVELMVSARKLGITAEEIREFLQGSKRLELNLYTVRPLPKNT